MYLERITSRKIDNGLVYSEHNYFKETSKLNDGTSHVDESENVRDKSDVTSEIAASSAKKQFKKCCMKHCLNTNEHHSMFSFPKVVSMKYGQTHVDSSNLKR